MNLVCSVALCHYLRIIARCFTIFTIIPHTGCAHHLSIVVDVALLGGGIACATESSRRLRAELGLSWVPSKASWMDGAFSKLRLAAL
jgi:hypothetical protein